MNLLQTKNLDLNIGKLRVCRGLELEIEAGQHWGLLGRNGAGKTTLLHTFAGLRAPTGGEVLLGGRPILDLPRRHVARRLGVLFQDSEDTFPASVLETALIGRHPHLGPWGWEQAEDLRKARASLAHVGLEKMERRITTTLSGGERRRLAIAALLTQEPEIALLDEPTNHLDLHQQLAMLDLLRGKATNGMTTLSILHDINLALRFCDHLLLLFGDGECTHGPTAHIATQQNLEQLYNLPLVKMPGPHGPLYIPA